MTSSIADFVVSLGTDGRITSQGTVSDAIKKNSLLLQDIQDEKQASERSEEQVDDGPQTNGDRVQGSKSDGKLIVAEEMAEGHVGWPASTQSFVLLSYRPAADRCSSETIFRKSGWKMAWHILDADAWRILRLRATEHYLDMVPGLLVRLSPSSSYLSTLSQLKGQSIRTPRISGCERCIVSIRPDDHLRSDINLTSYMTIYAALLGVAIVMRIAWFILFAFGHLRACRSLHRRLLDSVFGATLR